MKLLFDFNVFDVFASRPFRPSRSAYQDYPSASLWWTAENTTNPDWLRSESKDGKLYVMLDVPGAAKESIKITYEGNEITVKYNRGETAISRSISVSNVVIEDGEPSLQDGILTIAFPFKETKKKTKELVIK